MDESVTHNWRALNWAGECNGAVHLISLKDARRVNGAIVLSSTAPQHHRLHQWELQCPVEHS